MLHHSIFTDTVRALVCLLVYTQWIFLPYTISHVSVWVRVCPTAIRMHARVYVCGCVRDAYGELCSSPPCEADDDSLLLLDARTWSRVALNRVYRYNVCTWLYTHVFYM